MVLPSFACFIESRLAFIPETNGFANLISDQIPPTTIAPIPKYLICVLQMLSAASKNPPSKPLIAEYIGIATAQEINPPPTTKMPIFRPTM